MPIPEIFSRRGELWFRRTEETVIRELLAGEPGVLALGGGALESARTRDLRRPHGRRGVAAREHPRGLGAGEGLGPPPGRRPRPLRAARGRARGELPRGGRPRGRRRRPGRRGRRPGGRLGPARRGRGGRGEPGAAAGAGPLGRDRRRALPGPPRARASLDRLGELWAERGGRAAACCWSATATSPSSRGGPARPSRRPASASSAPASRPGEGSKSLAQVERLTRLAAEAGLRRTDAVVAARRRRRGRPGGLRRRHLPARRAPGPRADDPARDGRLGHRRQDRRRPARGQELRRRDLAARAGADGHRRAGHAAAARARLRLRRGRQVRPARGRRPARSGSRRWPELPGPHDDLAGLIRRCVAPQAARGGRGRARPRASARRSTSATPSATASRPPRATSATATARPSRWACSRRCGCPSRPSGSTRPWRRAAAAVLERHGLPTRLAPEVATPAILEAMGRDKKADAGALNMVMLAAPGDVRLRVSPPRRPGRLRDRGAAPMSAPRHRVALLHGPNLDQLGRRPSAHYGTLTLRELEDRVRALGRRARHGRRLLPDQPRGRLPRARPRPRRARSTAPSSTPGAWTHYQWSIRDALELLGAPFVEVHLSDIEAREPHRRSLGRPRHRLGGRLGQGPRRLPRRPRPPRGDAAHERSPRPARSACSRRSRSAASAALIVTEPRQRALPDRLRRLQRHRPDRGRRAACC